VRVRLPETGEWLTLPAELPLLPLRDTVLFPTATLPLFVGRPASVAALDAAVAGERIVFTVAQRDAATGEPERDELYAVGTIARVAQIYRLPDGTRRILAEGLAPARLLALSRGDAGARVTIAVLAAGGARPATGERTSALASRVRRAFQHYVEQDGRLAREAWLLVRDEDCPQRLAYRISACLRVSVAVRQRLLEAQATGRRLRLLERILQRESAAGPAEVPSTPRRRSRPARRPPQRVAAAEPSSELDELNAALAAADLPPTVCQRAEREMARLARTAPVSPEAAVTRNYLEWLLDLPWRGRTRDRTDLKRVQELLDQEHYGLNRIKERILEQMAVIKLAGEVRGPVLCLTGPPGVGKTSLARSIATALGRRFVRASLGGVRDEAEIRGHRRTYVGSLPGRILQGMRRAGVVNPLFLLDEVDKLASDHRGDPAAALLEVLDPEQNQAFSDHYLEIDYDLSQVLFVTTANLLDGIPAPLRDRMEVLRLPGYLDSEKLAIATQFLVPRQVRATGLRPSDLALPRPTLERLIQGYTREAGVRGLEREIARICRRVAKYKAGGDEPVLARTNPRRGRRALRARITPEQLPELIGAPRHPPRLPERRSRVGLATGLAWTEAGGEILTVECGVMPGRGRLTLTGTLGAVMRESARAALSYIRSRATQLGIPRRFDRRCDVHIHLPEGAIPKDGPSAGVTIALALVSALSGRPTRADVAMTGEITLRGAVLPVGGLAEKLVAARRAGLARLLLPEANRLQYEELPADLRADLAVEFVETMEAVLAVALEARPRPSAAVGEAPADPARPALAA